MPGRARKRQKRPSRARSPRVEGPRPVPRGKTPEPDPDRYVGLDERFSLAERATRSTLQLAGMDPELAARLDAEAPPYLFHGDRLMARTANGYIDTGTRALDFGCIARMRAAYRRDFNCSLPTRGDLGLPEPA